MTHPLILLALLSVADTEPGDRLQYNRDIRPVLSENCFSCHGPDANRRKAKLRLDVRKASSSGVRHLRPRENLSRALSGVDVLPSAVRDFGPGPACRLGVLVDHLVPGSKESRIVASVTSPYVLVTGHPYVDIWQAVKPGRLGIRGVAADPAGPPVEGGRLRRARGGRSGRPVAPDPGLGAWVPRRGDAVGQRGGAPDRLRDRGTRAVGITARARDPG